MATGNTWQRHTHLRPLAALTLLLALLPPMLGADVRAALPAVAADTPVGGPIISDTTWTLANSPYIVTENVTVTVGVTLTIQAGVVVKFDTNKLLQVDDTLVARGTAANPITFTSSQASPQKSDWGGIKFTDSSVDATFDGVGNYTGGCILEYCTVQYGGSGVRGVIWTDSASPLIDHCAVRHNGSSGVRAVGTSGTPVVIRYNTVSDNSPWDYGGGIYAELSTVTGNTVSGNSTNWYGGGIYASGSTVTGNTVSGNSAHHGGGGICAVDSTVTGNTVSGNSATGDICYGGGIYAAFSMVTGNTVSGNSTNWYGGGIYAVWSKVTGNIVSGNSANLYGGGIYASGSTVTGNTVSGNSTSDSGGGIYATHHFQRPYDNSTVISNTVTANSVPATGQGSGLYYHTYGSPNFLYNTIVGNTAPAGIIGGVAIEGTPQFHHNNLYGNSPYDVAVVTSSDVSGTNNYWGITATAVISAHIYDWYDDSSRGRLLFTPYLQDPDPNAPVLRKVYLPLVLKNH